jgi:hypothetical protein
VAGVGSNIRGRAAVEAVNKDVKVNGRAEMCVVAVVLYIRQHTLGYCPYSKNASYTTGVLNKKPINNQPPTPKLSVKGDF